MYLLDNHKNNIQLNILTEISKVNSINELTALSSKTFNGLDYFFNKINSGIGGMNPILDTKTSKENFKNLFLNPPLSMSLDSDEFKEVLDKFNSFSNPSELVVNRDDPNGETPLSDIFETYKSLLTKKIENNNNKTSYEIVGEVTKTFSKIFYGNNVINKHDMNILLHGVSSLNIIEKESSLDIDEVLKFVAKSYIDEEVPEEILVYIDNNQIDKIMPIISEKLTKMNDNLVENVNKEKLSSIKRETFTNLKTNLFQLLRNHEIYKYNRIKEMLEVSDMTSKELLFEIKEMHKNINNTTQEYFKLIDGTKNKDIKADLNKSISSYKELQLILANIIPSIEKVIKSSSESYVQRVNSILVDKNFSILDNTLDQIDYIDDKPKYMETLKDFQKLNSKFLNSQSIEKTKFMNQELIKYVGLDDSKEVFINNVDKITSTLGQKINDYSLDEIKELLYITLSNNKTIYDMKSNSELFNNLENNNLIKDITSGKIEIPDIDIQRLKYVSNIIIYKKDIEDLFKTDININIKDLFYNNLGLSMDSEKGHESLKEVLLLFNDMNKKHNIKNQNILLGMILESYDNGRFDSKRFNKFVTCLNMPVNRLKQVNKDILNTLSDSWVKWSVTYNRELRDSSLLMSKINPVNYQFGEMQAVKKLIEDNCNSKDENFKFNKYDYLLFQIYIDKDLPIDNKVINLYDKVKDIFRKNKDQGYLFVRSLENIYNSDFAFINEKLKEIDLNSDKHINNIVNEVVLLSRVNNFLNDDRIDIDKVNIKSIYNILKDQKDIGKAMQDLPSELYYNILYNIEAIPKMTKNTFSKYIEYFKTMSELPTFKNYKEEDSLIPLIHKEMGSGYSYKVKTIKDFDILLTGEKTDNCMTYQNAGWDIFKYMYENPTKNVLFEVYKDGKPVANSWTWINEDNKQITFDNIEVLGDDLRDNVIHCYRDVSLEFINKTKANKITFGTGYTDIDIEKLGNKSSRNFYRKLVANCYTDSGDQRTIVTTSPYFSGNSDKMIDKLQLSKSFIDDELFSGFAKEFRSNEAKHRINPEPVEDSYNINFNIWR